MYIARKQIDGETRYILRESYVFENQVSSRDIIELSFNPSDYIIYPGGNSYYIKDILEDEIRAAGFQPDTDELEEMFQPFLRPDIKRAVDHFRTRSGNRNKRTTLTDSEKTAIHNAVHAFDKRRLHYLRFGNMDQGPVSRMPATLFRHLIEKSRDEIEQQFIESELQLPASEQKSYVYVAFDLQRFFPNFLAAKMPHALDQSRVDHHFLEEICLINRLLFCKPDVSVYSCLHEHLVRYLIMFFDNDYARTSLLDDYVKDFIYRHHSYHPPPPVNRVSVDEASRIFGFEKGILPTMTRKGVTRRYRKLAKKHHPDKGGSNEAFVLLNDAYQRLLREVSVK